LSSSCECVMSDTRALAFCSRVLTEILDNQPSFSSRVAEISNLPRTQRVGTPPGTPTVATHGSSPEKTGMASLLWRLSRAAMLPAAVGATMMANSATMPKSEPAVKAQAWDSLFRLDQEKSIAGKVALVTGCSSGIGKATACMLATAGCELVLVARREDKLSELKGEILKRQPSAKVTVVVGDVCTDAFYETLKAQQLHTKVDILIANAGLAVGKDNIGAASDGDWEQMMSANCMGAFRLINLCLPEMVKNGGGHIVATGSIAGMESYEGGSVYCASKHALHAFMKSLRFETYSKNVRVTVLAPGLVGEGTEFSEVRFKGDASKASATYQNIRELKASDCAAQILWALRQPDHVNVDLLQLMPTAQGGATRLHRGG